MSSPFIWTGRHDPEDGPLAVRWHHHVTFDPAGADLALLGFPCDVGVARNKGRPGAAAAPDVLRGALANLAWHGDGRIADCGNLAVAADAADPLAAAQADLSRAVATILRNSGKLIVLGGGHETAAGSFAGLLHSLDAQAPQRIGILNLDAHFDIRLPGENGLSSGTPFTQIREMLGQQGLEFHYLVLGISQLSNTRALFERADSWGVQYLLDEAIGRDGLAPVLARIDAFLRRIDVLYVSLDLDVLPHWQMPAVSAPAACGVDLLTIEAIIRHIGHHLRQGGVQWPLTDVVEFNPAFDATGNAARTAARLIDGIARAMLAKA